MQVGADIGDARLLEAEYEEPRQRANLAMMGALDALKRIFAAQVASSRSPSVTFHSIGTQTNELKRVEVVGNCVPRDKPIKTASFSGQEGVRPITA